MSDPLRLTLSEDDLPSPRTRCGRPRGPEPGIALTIWIPAEKRRIYDHACRTALREDISLSALALQLIEQAFRP